jgi:zinc transport system permease protein
MDIMEVLMIDFWQALWSPEGGFLRIAMLAGLFSSVSFGMIGSFVVVRRVSYIAGAVSHSVLGGIGLSMFLEGNYGWTFPPMLGATLAALLSAAIIAWVDLRVKERSDSIIGAIWVIGMAGGILLLSRTPGYVDPSSYLFGNILLVRSYDLWAVLALDILVIILSIFLYHRLVAVSFDPQFAQLRGIRTARYHVGFLLLTALSIVVMVRIVGIVLVIALLTLPAATAGRWVRNLWQMMLLSVVLVSAYTLGGIGLSYYWELPSGAVIVLLAGLVYLLSLTKSLFIKKGSSVKQKAKIIKE